MDPAEILVNTKKLTGPELLEAMAQLLRNTTIEEAFSRAQRPGDLIVKTIDLEGAGGLLTGPATASALYPDGLKIDFPFKSVYVADASDANAKIYFLPGTTQGNKSLGLQQPMIPLSLKDSHVQDFAAAQGLLVWPNQPGKSITLVFSINSETRSGSQVQLVAGGITVSNGSAIFNDVFGPAGTSGSFPLTALDTILPANANRKVTRFQVSGGDIRIGDSPTATTGLLLSDGDYYEHRNTGALKGFPVSGLPVITGTEET